MGKKLLFSLFLLTSCAKRTVPPVIDGWKNSTQTVRYLVQPGDTLYSIAWSFNLNEEELARINHLVPPFKLKSGMKLSFSGAGVKNISNYPQQTSIKNIWHWPTKSKVKYNFHQPNLYQKGIEFTGNLGQPVYSANQGTIVYRGSSLAAYGNLVIIKHDNDYLSAYGHLKDFKVDEGEKVKAHQVIGTMGTQQGQPSLHFEIRRFGQPLDPQTLLNPTKHP